MGERGDGHGVKKSVVSRAVGSAREHLPFLLLSPQPERDPRRTNSSLLQSSAELWEASRAECADSLALEQQILLQTVPVPLSDAEISLLTVSFPFNTYFLPCGLRWEEQLSDLCTRYIRQKGHFWISIRQGGHP